MASFGNVTSHLVGRELSIASSFVKQYYTLLNKAPHLIYNFYSLNSTFIHGSVEMVNKVQYTEPMVGREKIKKKMEDLKLNDCRAKIKQIDCLETLAGGLVIQVIGELSNNGKPMRRFLQTFVLAPRDDSPSGDSQRSQKSQLSGEGFATTSSNSTQKFFVLNSIFRYQDDSLDSESDEDAIMLTNISSFNNNELNSKTKTVETSNNEQMNNPSILNQLPNHQQATSISNNNTNAPIHHHHHNAQPNGINSMDAASQTSQVRKRPPTTEVTQPHPRRMGPSVDRLAHELKEVVKMRDSTSNQQLESEKTANGNECKREASVVASKVASTNDSVTIPQQENKSENYRISHENGKVNTEHASKLASSSSSTNDQASISNSANPTISSSLAVTPKPQPSNEPKTWANMVKNAQPSHPVSSVQPSTISNQINSTAANAAKPTTSDYQSLNQPPSNQSHPQPHQQSHQQQLKQNQPLQQQQPLSPSQQSQTHPQQPQQQIQGQQQPQQQQQTSLMNNNLNRRRNMPRKPSSKPNGRTMKPRSRPPLVSGQSSSVTPTTTSSSSTTTIATSAPSLGKPPA